MAFPNIHGLDALQDPVPNTRFLMNSIKISSDDSIIPTAVRKLAGRKRGLRIHRQTFMIQRRSKLGRRQRLQKWQSTYFKDRTKILNKKRGNNNELQSNNLEEHSPPKSIPSTPSSSTSEFSVSTYPTTPGSWPTDTPTDRWTSELPLDKEYKLTLPLEKGSSFADDDDDRPLTPSPIRNSPSYGRRRKNRNVDSRKELNTPSSVRSDSPLYPELPKEIVEEDYFTPYHLEPLEHKDIDDQLIEKIRLGPTGKKYNSELGAVYTAAIQDNHRYVKIGYTGKDVKKRVSSISSGKYNGSVHNVNDNTPGTRRRFLNAHLAEQIIHLELSNYRRIMTETENTEWFEIDITEAQQVRRRWQDWFIRWKPYNENKQLKAFWRARLDRIRAYDSYDEKRHKNLHQRWTKVLNPSWWEIALDHVYIGWTMLCACWIWMKENKVASLTFLTIISYILYGSLAAFICILASATILSQPTSTKSKKKGRATQ